MSEEVWSHLPRRRLLVVIVRATEACPEAQWHPRALWAEAQAAGSGADAIALAVEWITADPAPTDRTPERRTRLVIMMLSHILTPTAQGYALGRDLVDRCACTDWDASTYINASLARLAPPENTAPAAHPSVLPAGLQNCAAGDLPQGTASQPATGS